MTLSPAQMPFPCGCLYRSVGGDVRVTHECESHKMQREGYNSALERERTLRQQVATLEDGKAAFFRDIYTPEREAWAERAAEGEATLAAERTARQQAEAAVRNLKAKYDLVLAASDGSCSDADLTRMVEDIAERMTTALAEEARRRIEQAEAERLEMARALDRALHGEVIARPISPKETWERLLAKVEALRRVVLMLEWDDARYGSPCPLCHQDQQDDHAFDCAIAAALKEPRVSRISEDVLDAAARAGDARLGKDCSVCRRPDCTREHACE